MNRRGASNEMEKCKRESQKKMRMQKFSEGQLTHSLTSVVIEKKTQMREKKKKSIGKYESKSQLSVCIYWHAQ